MNKPQYHNETGIFENDRNNREYWKMDRDTGSTLSFKDGFFVLELHGTPYERGFAHGKLLREEIEKSNISAYYGNFLKNLFESSDIAKKIPHKAVKPIRELLERWYYSPLEKMCLPETRDEAYGICDAMGWKEDKKKQSLRGLFAPDIMEQLAAAYLPGEKTDKNFWNYNSYINGGCSAAYARGDAVRNKSFSFLARNLDFPGAFVWNPAVIFSYPTEKLTRLEKRKMIETGEVKQPYVYVSAAGFPGFGLTGLNSSGLAMATFVCLSKNCTAEGMSTLDFNHYLFTRAKSIDDIGTMIKNPRLKSMSPHVVMFADGEKAISLEVDSKNKKIMYSPGDGIYVQTNHFQNPVLEHKQFMFPLERDSTFGRYWVLQTALKQEGNYGNLDLQRMVDIISCNLDMRKGKTALVGNFPAQPNTLASAVFRLYGKAGISSNPKKNELWVATGKPPAVCYNPYSKFAFKEDFSWDKKEGGTVKRSSRPVIGGTKFTPITPQMKESLKHFLLSEEDLKMGKLKFALANMGRARACYDNPQYQYIESILHMQNGDINTAYNQFVSLYKNNSFDHAQDFDLGLFIGRCLDVLGKRDEAINCYKKIRERNNLSEEDEKIVSLSIKKPFSLAKMPSSIDFLFRGPLERIKP